MTSTLPAAEWLQHPTNNVAFDLGPGAATNIPVRYCGVRLAL